MSLRSIATCSKQQVSVSSQRKKVNLVRIATVFRVASPISFKCFLAFWVFFGGGVQA
jgi:hypothetical protein